MALQTSGEISLANVQTEFGGANPISISEYYGKAAGIPASGTISLSHFYGKSNIIREPASGEYYNRVYYSSNGYWFSYDVSKNRSYIVWAGVSIFTGSQNSGRITTYSDGTYTYYSGTFKERIAAFGTTADFYGVYRINN